MSNFVVEAKFVVIQELEVDAKTEVEAKSKALRILLGEMGWNSKLEQKLKDIGIRLECTVVHQLWDISKKKEVPSNESSSTSKTKSKKIRSSGGTPP